ncbi:AAA-ATPase ASD, mitochondrial [Linum perenne]
MLKMAGILIPHSVTEMWSTVGSSIATLLFLSTIFRQYFPYELRRYLETNFHRLSSHFFNPCIKISIHEFTGDRLKRSEAYSAVEAYLSTNSSLTATRLKAEMSSRDSSSLVLTMDDHEQVSDEFRGVKVWWHAAKVSSNNHPQSSNYPDRRYYRLSFNKRHRQLITEEYLRHVVRVGKEIRLRNRQRKLYTNSPGHKWPSFKQTMWSHIPFEHPATFDTMAMDPSKKEEIIDDLITFTKSREFYSRIGKSWKRGYLLYGPPGTGKSTMIAAMANLLNYDVYDLELTAVKDNTDLRKLLIDTTSKSIIVIEDIDCSLDLTGQRKKRSNLGFDEMEGLNLNSIEKEIIMAGRGKEGNKDNQDSRVTLSGLLNFIDGLWSSCGGERLIVFTTNCVEKLDPALIRRGRMDKHIELSYCSFEAFRILARNYLKVEDHPMFTEVEKLINEIQITPADVAENLMLKSPSDDAGKCLSKLIAAMEEVKANEAPGNGKDRSEKGIEAPVNEEDRSEKGIEASGNEEDQSEKGIVSQKIVTDLVDL